jgi:hypothetical protein
MARVDPKAAAEFYLHTKDRVRKAGFDWEIEWQYGACISDLTENIFLRESAWVIFSAGFRESVLRAKFPAISAAFLEWKAASLIWASQDRCRRAALSVFKHFGKVNAVISLAKTLDTQGFDYVQEQIAKNGVKFLQTLPYIGPVTSFHLAKNIGIPCVKPDRHLVRLSQRFGAKSAHDLCEAVRSIVGDPLQVIDVVFWRYCTLDKAQRRSDEQSHTE